MPAPTTPAAVDPDRLTVNGQAADVEVDVESDRSLLEVLREDLHLTGTKYGCGEGACGACTVLVDGKPTFSCTTRAADAVGKSIVTIEGLAQGEKLHPVQEAFCQENAFQCGYCTPGMVLATVALLGRTSKPSDAEIKKGLNNHLCRCCGYLKVVDAVKRAGELTLASAKGGTR